MANKKLTELDAVTSVLDTDSLYIVQGGVSKKITVANSRNQSQLADQTPVRLLTLTYAKENAGSFVVDANNLTGGVIGIKDPIFWIGYNRDAIGNRLVATEPVIGMAFEADWEEAGSHQAEWYLQYLDPTGTMSSRPIFLDINHDDGGHRLKLNSEAITFNTPNLSDPTSNITYFTAAPALFQMAGFATGNSVMQINGGAGYAGAVYLGYNEDNDHTILVPTSATTTSLKILDQQIRFGALTASQTQPNIHFGAVTPQAHLHIGILHASVAGIEIDSITGQSASLILIKVGSAYPLRVTKSGYLLVASNLAPADAEVLTSSALFWFDNTNGAGKFMIKAKTADGTIVTGEVALA